jgi:hypothetical protein
MVMAPSNVEGIVKLTVSAKRACGEFKEEGEPDRSALPVLPVHEDRKRTDNAEIAQDLFAPCV